MSTIKIDWLTDSNDCETCGGGYSEGARVWIDGEVAFDFQPVATCTGGRDWNQEEVYRAIFAKFGHTLELGTW